MATIDAPKAPSKAAAPEKPAPAPVTGGLRHQDGRTFQVVSFRPADEASGVDIMTVQEIIVYGCITQVPEVPEYVLGVINLRGNVIPILNLRRCLGMPDQPANDATRIVVMDLTGRTVGVVVDGVSEVLRLSHEDISPAPPSLLRAVWNDEPPRRGHWPAADVLFESCLSLAGRGVGVIMTGMGQDGASGLLALRQAGWTTIGQDEASCAIYGMPRAAMQLGAVEHEHPLAQLGAALVAACEGRLLAKARV